jgi:ABC-type transport system substrate-binding protein
MQAEDPRFAREGKRFSEISPAFPGAVVMFPRVTFRRLHLIYAPFLLFIASCQRESQVDRATREEILLVGNSNEPKGLDPHIVSGVLEANILRTLFEGLIASDPQSDTGNPPGAALEVTPDATATVWTAKLRPGGKWSDGMPVTAHDFAFSYERILRPELGAKYAEMLYFLKGADDFNQGKTTWMTTPFASPSAAPRPIFGKSSNTILGLRCPATLFLSTAPSASAGTPGPAPKTSSATAPSS